MKLESLYMQGVCIMANVAANQQCKKMDNTHMCMAYSISYYKCISHTLEAAVFFRFLDPSVKVHRAQTAAFC